MSFTKTGNQNGKS